MLAYHVTLDLATRAAQAVSVQIIHWRQATGRAVRFRLGLADCACPPPLHRHRRSCRRRYQRLSAGYGRHERHVAAVCWHGHRDYFRALFGLAPDARVVTAHTLRFPVGARFYSAPTFEARYGTTGQATVGPPIDPIAYRNCCTCKPDEDHRITFSTLTPAGPTDVRLIRQADVRRCPFVILMAEHYRPDGSCRCDDAEHRAMMMRDWDYTQADFVNIPLRQDGDS